MAVDERVTAIERHLRDAAAREAAAATLITELQAEVSRLRGGGAGPTIRGLRADARTLGRPETFDGKDAS